MSTKSRFRRIGLISLTLLVALSVATVPLAADWKGSLVNKDGVAHVMNPSASVTGPETVTLKELWRVGGDDDEVLFGVITDIVADRDGNFYLLDSQLTEIQVYAPDGEYLRTIGREGEGPGEFRNAFNLMLLPNGDIGVLQAFPSKFIGLTRDGKPADAFSLPESDEGGFKTLFAAKNGGDHVGVVYGFMQPGEGGFTQTSVLSIFDGKGGNERRLHDEGATMSAASPVIAEREWDSFRNNRWAAGPDGRVSAAVDFGQYRIKVWNPDGKLLHVLEREYPAHPRTPEQLAETREIYQGFTRRVPVPNLKFDIEENWNPIRALYARDDGSIWVMSSRGTTDQPAGTMGIFDVFDKNGRFARQVTIKGQGNPEKDGYFFVKDRLFVVTDWLNAMMALQGGGGSEEMDEDAEPMEIISYQLP